MKLLITWIGPWLDKGEAAMLISMGKMLRDKFPEIDITASASSFQLENIDMIKYKRYGFSVMPGIFPSIFSTLPKPTGIRSKTLKILILLPPFLIKITGTIIWAILYKNLNIDAKLLVRGDADIVKSYKESDCVIFCGGQNVTNLNINIIISFYEIVFSKMLGKPVMIWANSLGPFKPEYIRPIVTHFINKVDIITTREETSKNCLDHIGVTAPSFVTADSAFVLPTVTPEEALSLIKREMENPENRPMVGITVIPWRFPGEINPDEKFEDYLNAMAGAVDHIIEKLGAHVLFFPQVIVTNIKDDRPISRKVLNKVKNKTRVTVLTNDYSPEQLKGMYGLMSFLIGTRFHSCIFAQSMHVPTIAIEYDGHKALGIMKLLGTDIYVCDINTITSSELISKIDEVWNNRDEISQILGRNVKVMREKCMNNLSLAVEFLDLK